MEPFQEELCFTDPKADECGEVKHPGFYIAQELKDRDWSQIDLSRIIQRPIPTINEVVTGKKALMPEMAIALGMAFGTGARIWIHREAAYRLAVAQSSPSDTESEELAELYSVAPVKELEKRGWIAPTSSSGSLRGELERFYGNCDFELNFGAAARKSDAFASFTSSQKAWLRRAEQLARVVPAKEFSGFSLAEATDLKSLAKKADTMGRIPQVLAHCGIRFVIVEPLPRSRIDGAAFWMDDASPVVALSLRYDRIDSFWHTLAHELSHITHRDKTSLDIDLVGSERSALSLLDEIEARADREGAEWLVPSDALKSFVRRHSPFFSAADIELFARAKNIHPGIVVGQLHHLNAIDFKHHRKMLSKVRSTMSAVATTDGFGAPMIRARKL